MSATSTPAFAALEQQLTAMRLGVGPSEVHGALTGFLCAGGQPGGDDWLEVLQLQGAEPAANVEVQASLDALAATTAEAIEPRHADLELLLPADGAGLEKRALALVDWCRGFLGGFGLAGVDAAGLQPGMADVLRDFADIAGTIPEPGDNQEDQQALVELVDHVRFGALLLHAQLTVPRGATRQ